MPKHLTLDDLRVPFREPYTGLDTLLNAGDMVDAIDYLMLVEGPLAVPGVGIDPRRLESLANCIRRLCRLYTLDIVAAQSALGYIPTQFQAWMANLQALAAAEANRRLDNYPFDLPLHGAADWTMAHRRLFLHAVNLQRDFCLHGGVRAHDSVETVLTWGQIRGIADALAKAYPDVQVTRVREQSLYSNSAPQDHWLAAIEMVASDMGELHGS